MYPGSMARMLQVRNLPDDVHVRLKERAAAERMSLSDFVARELGKLVQYRSNAEVLQAARDRLPRIDPAVLASAFADSRDPR